MRRRLPLIAAGVLVFLTVSFGLARYLSTENEERNKIFDLLTDQARGNTGAMLGRLDGCGSQPACVKLVRDNARRLRRDGRVRIVRLDSDTSYALGSATGPTRVVWTVIGHGLTVVQCVEVQRKGSALAGRSVTLRRLSAPIDRQASC